MKTLYVVLGHADTRKSSTIRCLTGVSSKRKLVELYLSTKKNVTIVVRTAAPQEYNFRIPIQLERDFSRYGIALTALRISKSRKWPAGKVYIDHFRNNGWDVKIVELNKGGTPSGIIGAYKIDIAGMANNRIASIVRGQWKWF